MEKSLFDLIQDVKQVCVITEDRIRKEFNLSYVELMALHRLAPHEKLTGSEFSERMNFSPARGSRVINQLNSKGIIHTTVLPYNRRSMEICLSPTGCRLKQQVDSEIQKCENRIMTNADKPGKARIKQALAELHGLMKTAHENRA